MRSAPFVRLVVPVLGFAITCSATSADDNELAGYFGFDGLEVVKIDPNAGPFVVADVNSDGLNDLVVANNSKSRIEIQYQKAGARPTDEVAAPTRVNELPEHWRFRREYVSVGHAITAIVPYDFDGDGLLDFVYAGQPGTIGFLRQTKPGTFELVRKVPVKKLAPGTAAFTITDLVGDSKKDVAAIVDGRLTVWQLDGTNLGDPVELSAGSDSLVALVLGDYDGDGTTDVAGIVPDNTAPVRIWRGASETKDGVTTKGLGSQVRFEMPPLREAKAIKLPGHSASELAVIEKPSRRIVVYDLKPAPVETSGTREAPLTVWGFSDAGNRKRSVATVDLDGDGLLDVIATNTQNNSVVVWRQAKDKGLQPSVEFPAYADLDAVVAGDVDGDKAADIFLLSEKEGVVGRTKFADGAIAFPQAMTIAAGHVPVVESLVKLDEGTRLAVVLKDGRNFVLELLPVTGSDSASAKSEPIKLGALAKQPDAIVALDADRDGKTDLLLFTADKPMTMLRAGLADGKPVYTPLESKDMGQFGLVQAANDQNTAVFDIDGDGKPELLVADKNFIRALRYDEKPPQSEGAKVSPGWQVVRQLNAERGDAKLVSIIVLPAHDSVPARIIAADRENSALLMFAQDSSPSGGGAWKQSDVLTVSGFKFSGIKAGSFSGDGKDDVLAIGDDGFAIVRLEGERLKLQELAAWRSDSTRRVHHEIVQGDVNGDKRLDLIALDAGEQMAEILTFSDAGRLLYATGFKVFESRMFTSGEPKEFEPSMGFVVDVTGDKADDLVLLCHDRILLYPQAAKKP